MEFFRDTNIQFMKYRKYWVVVSAVLLVASLFAVIVHGKLNLGIDFAGGTQLTLKFRDEPQVEDLRDLMESVGIGEAQIQRFGVAGANEVLIKTPSAKDSEEGSRDVVVSAIEQAFPAAGSGPDLNRVGAETLADFLVARDPDSLVGADPEVARAAYLEDAEAVIEIRRGSGLIATLDEISEVPGVSAPVLAALKGGCSLGQFSLLGAENVGPQIGSELRQKGVLAVLASLLGMLAYIWFRFELRFGMGALVAVVHDVVIVLGFYAMADFEFNLTTVAAFLTLIGYSVNDTVVVFDRVRENIRRSRGRPLVDTMNLSINQTLSRTILTSGTTLLALGCLLFLGGDVLRGFAFILTIGIVVGTYSSIYVASPFAMLWEQVFGGAARLNRRESKAARR
jgi:preprotein translocase subunit SecF